MQHDSGPPPGTSWPGISCQGSLTTTVRVKISPARSANGVAVLAPDALAAAGLDRMLLAALARGDEAVVEESKHFKHRWLLNLSHSKRYQRNLSTNREQTSPMTACGNSVGLCMHQYAYKCAGRDEKER